MPVSPLTPRPYTSTAHLPTPYAHRLVSQYNMSLYAELTPNYPSNPPGEPEWPTFLQVCARFSHVFHMIASFVVQFIFALVDQFLQTYGSAVSLPSDSSGIAYFDRIGLFDLPHGSLFQVFIVGFHKFHRVAVFGCRQQLHSRVLRSGRFRFCSWCFGCSLDQCFSTFSRYYIAAARSVICDV